MFSKTQDKYLRNFLNYSSRSGSIGLPSMEEPTFMGFHIFFDFKNSAYKYDPEQVVTGLLLDGNDSDSAINYLLRKGKDEPAALLNKFIQILKDIEENKPWMFQSIEGLNTISGGLKPGKTWRGQDVELTINCLETLDTRMSFLASLYNTAVYDKIWHRMNLPFDKRKFNCKIIVSEIRNLGALLSKEEHPDTIAIQKSNNRVNNNPFLTGDLAPIGDINNGLDNLGFKTEKEALLKFGKDVEKPTSDFLKDTANFGKNSINESVNWIEGGLNNSGFGGLQNFVSDALGFTNQNTNSPSNEIRSGWEWSNTASKLSTIKTKKIFSNIDRQMTFYVFNLYDCEFVFDDMPFLDSVSINNLSEQAAFKFKIKVGYPTEEHQFRFFNWLISDYYDSILVDKNDIDLHNQVRLNQQTIYDYNKILPFEQKTKYRLDSFNPIVKEINSEEEINKLKQQSPGDKGNMFDAVANAYKGFAQIDDAVSKLTGGKYKGVNNEAKKELNKIKNNIDRQKIQFLKKHGSFIKALGELNLSDPYSIINAVNESLDLIRDKKNTHNSNIDNLTNWDPQTKPNVKTKNDILYSVIRELNSEQVTKNRFWKNSTQMDWKNLGFENVRNSSNEKIQGSNIGTSNEQNTKWEYLGRYKRPHPDDKDINTNGIIRRIGFNEMSSINRLGLATSVDKFKNLKYNGDYLERYKRPTLNDEKHIKYRFLRTVFDVPDKPDKILSERPGSQWKIKDWKNLGHGVNTNLDNIDNQNRFNYLRKYEIKNSNENINFNDFGYGTKITGNKKTANIYYDKTLNINKNIVPINLRYTEVNKSVTPISLEGANSNKSITPISLEGANSNKSITPISLEGEQPGKSVTPISLEGEQPNKSITPISLEGEQPGKSVTPISLEGEQPNKSITPISLEGEQPGKSVTPISLEGANSNKSITPISLEGEQPDKSVTPISLEGANSNKSITPISLEGEQPNKSITPISLEGGQPDKSVTPISLKGANFNKSITPISLEGANSNKSITPISFINNKKDISPTKIGLIKNNQRKSITSISFKSVKQNNKIISSTLKEEINKINKISKINLTGAIPNDKIIPIKFNNLTKLEQVDPKKLELIVPVVITSIQQKNIYKK